MVHGKLIHGTLRKFPFIKDGMDHYSHYILFGVFDINNNCIQYDHDKWKHSITQRILNIFEISVNKSYRKKFK